jgi:hypothetical protein
VAQGQSAAQFAIATAPSTRTVSVTILATYGAVTKTAKLRLVKG